MQIFSFFFFFYIRKYSFFKWIKVYEFFYLLMLL